MRTALLLIIFSFTTCFAQSIGKLFKDFLPQSIKTNESSVSQLSVPLKIYAELNPDLIYYYVKYLEARFDSSSGDKYFLKNLYKIICRYKTQNINWIDHLEKQIRYRNIDEQLMDQCLGYVNSYSYSLPEDTCINPESKTDYNLLNFFAVKYYLNDNGLKYNHSKNYRKERDSLEINKALPFKQMQDNPLKYSKYDLKTLFTNWYVFINKNISKPDVDPASIITSVIREYYLNERLYGHKALILGFSNLRNNMTIPGNLYYSPDFAIPDSEHVFNSQTISLSINYKLFLSKYILPFSYLNFQFSAGYGFANNTFRQDSVYRMSNVDGVSNRNKIIIFSKNEISLKGMGFLSLNISTPVLFIRHKLSIDPGVGLGVYINNYELSYDYTYRKFDSEFYAPVVLDTYSSGPVSKKDKSIHLTAYPLLYIKYYFNNSYLLQLTVSNKIVSLDAGINL